MNFASKNCDGFHIRKQFMIKPTMIDTNYLGYAETIAVTNT